MEDALWAQIMNAVHDDDDARAREQNDSGADSDASDDEQEAPAPAVHNQQMSESVRSPTGNGRHTGPKGVMADHAYYNKVKVATDQAKRDDHNSRMLSKALMTTTYLEDVAASKQEVLVLEHQESDDDDLLEDEEILALYRQKRLDELREMSNHGVRKQHRLFGTLKTVEAYDYATAIDNEWKTVPVIIHLYDDSIPECRKLDDHLRGLASTYALAKFIRVSAVDLEFDLVGSPAVLAYKSGLLIANMVRFVDQVGPRFSPEAVEDCLVRFLMCLGFSRCGALCEKDLYEPSQKDEDDED
ncbi:thioredoxin-like protein [Phycomyces nitens]|nr:thioredoxin-like protein [Phycomyces nitens]